MPSPEKGVFASIKNGAERGITAIQSIDVAIAAFAFVTGRADLFYKAVGSFIVGAAGKGFLK